MKATSLVPVITTYKLRRLLSCILVPGLLSGSHWSRHCQQIQQGHHHPNMVIDLKSAIAGQDRNMVLEEERLATFKGWPHKVGLLTAANMAKAGFYYTPGEKGADDVRCFCCYKELNNWDDDDDPWKEHLKHRPSCLFAKLHTEEAKLTVNQLIQVMTEREGNRIKMFSSNITYLKEVMESLDNLS